MGEKTYPGFPPTVNETLAALVPKFAPKIVAIKPGQSCVPKDPAFVTLAIVGVCAKAAAAEKLRRASIRRIGK
jgi:hypothetical protein